MKGTSLLTACSDGVVRKFILNESLHGPRTIEVFTRLEEKENSQIKMNLAVRDSKVLSEPGSFEGQVQVCTDESGK